MSRLSVTAACLLALGTGQRASALPLFAQRYRVACTACHAPVPQLNATGRAFQANFYRWSTPTKTSPALPVSYQQTLTESTVQSLTGTRQSPLGELFLAGELSAGAFRAQLYTRTDGALPQKSFGELALTLPLLGPHGALALTVGQTSALPFQYTPNTRLIPSPPEALAASAGGYSFTEPRPLVRLEWFSQRGSTSAEGDYLSLAMPFNSALTLTPESEFGTGFGLSLHGFRRWEHATLGAFAYENGTDNRLGVLATRELDTHLSLLAALSTGHDLGSSAARASVEATWLLVPTVALVGRWEQTPQVVYPVFGLTAALPRLPGLRLGLEANLHPGQRSTLLNTRLAL